jgi:hypothetical protein
VSDPGVARTRDLWRERPLTPGERAIGAFAFGPSLPLGPIRLVKARLAPGRFAVATPFDRVVFCARAALPDDFARTAPPVQAWLVHELTHLWQARVGVNLALAKLGALGRGAYAWRLSPGRRFLDHNIEQQAEMTACHFLLTRGWVSHPDAHGLRAAFAGEAAAGRAPAVFLRDPREASAAVDV